MPLRQSQGGSFIACNTPTIQLPHDSSSRPVSPVFDGSWLTCDLAHFLFLLQPLSVALVPCCSFVSSGILRILHAADDNETDSDGVEGLYETEDAVRWRLQPRSSFDFTMIVVAI